MRMRLCGLALAGLLLAASAQAGRPAGSHHLSGGGTASISQIAVNVTIAGSGTASGQFECLMAGRSAFVLPGLGLGLKHIMAVHATPTSGSISGSVATFAGPARLVTDNGQKRAVDVSVWVDVATQRFQLTVVQIGTLPVETMRSGHISMR